MSCIKAHFGNPYWIVNTSLDKLSQFKPPCSTVHARNTQYSALSSYISTNWLQSQHPFFNKSKSSSKKRSTPVGQDWNKYVLKTLLLQPPLNDFSDWLSIYAKTCRDLPAPTASTMPANEILKPWIQKTHKQFHLSQRPPAERGSCSDGNKQDTSRTVVYPNNETCQNLYKCSQFQSLSRSDRRVHAGSLAHCFNYSGRHILQHFKPKKMVELEIAAESIIVCSMRALEEIIRK